MRAVTACCEFLFDADDRHDAGGFQLAPSVAEKCLHAGDVETAADLVKACDRERSPTTDRGFLSSSFTVLQSA
jgi:hypothetical protein